MNGGIDVDGFKDFKMTEEKVRKLLPLIESILSREYGRKIKLKDLTVGGITVRRDELNNKRYDNLKIKIRLINSERTPELLGVLLFL